MKIKIALSVVFIFCFISNAFSIPIGLSPQTINIYEGYKAPDGSYTYFPPNLDEIFLGDRIELSTQNTDQSMDSFYYSTAKVNQSKISLENDFLLKISFENFTPTSGHSRVQLEYGWNTGMSGFGWYGNDNIETWAMTPTQNYWYTSSLSLQDNNYSGTLVLEKIGNSLRYFLEDLPNNSWYLEDVISNFDAKQANFGFTLYTHGLGNATVDILGIDYAESTPVPEPSTFVLLSIGLAGLVILSRRRNKE